MQHPDEGTIHAWLDGALDAGEATRVAEHVAGCVECESRVVEARGLIAGASRVLSALDAVPAAVIPSREAVPNDDEPKHDRPGYETRHWWRRRGVTPALAAAAAVVFVAVGSSLVLRERPNAERVTIAPVQAEAPRAVEPARSDSAVAPSASARTSRPIPRPATPTAPRSAPAVVATTMVPHREAETRPRATATQPPRTADAMVLGGLAASAAASSDAAKAAPAPAPTVVAAPPRSTIDETERKAASRPSADSATRVNRLRNTPAQLENVVVTSVGGAAARSGADPQARAQRQLAGESRGAPAPADTRLHVGDFAGCYSVVDGDVALVPRRFVLDTTVTTTILPDSAGARALPPLVTTRLARSSDAERPATGGWTVLGPVAQVVFTSAEGRRAAIELRAAIALQFTARLTVDGATRSITLRRCAE